MRARRSTLSLFAALTLANPAFAQAPPAPAVGDARAEFRPVTDSAEFVGRVEAIDRVAVTARVTAFLAERLFTEGAEVATGTVLFRLDRAQFEAEARRQEAVVAEARAKLANADIQLERVRKLIGTPADKRAAVDDAVAVQRAATAQLMSAEALSRLAEINLGYTEILSPIAGKIGRAGITPGNAVGPASGPLAIIVSQDPMDVLFPVATRTLLELEDKLKGKGGLTGAKVRIRLSNGAPYGPLGTIDYADPSVARTTDTIMLRARLPNPTVGGAGAMVERGLIDGSLVGVIVEGAEPTPLLAIPRAAILADQQGTYVYIVGAENKVELRRVRLGQSTPALAVIADGLREGERVIVEGVQRARPGGVVNPAPVPPRPGAG
jgi:membrane fusion protein (multidrug efflux system)